MYTFQAHGSNKLSSFKQPFKLQTTFQAHGSNKLMGQTGSILHHPAAGVWRRRTHRGDVGAPIRRVRSINHSFVSFFSPFGPSIGPSIRSTRLVHWSIRFVHFAPRKRRRRRLHRRRTHATHRSFRSTQEAAISTLRCARGVRTHVHVRWA